MNDINRYLDAAILMPEFTRDQATAAIKTCLALNTYTVCVRPCDIELAQALCKGSDTGVCVVLGFPHGLQLSVSKADEARRYAKLGVDEIDMVVNYGHAKSGLWDEVHADIAGVVEASNVPVKVIFETSQLDLPTVKKLVAVCIEAGADFVKTSTGFNGSGASEEAVAAMVKAANGKIKVKPSGSIRDHARAEMFVNMGAHRLGVNWSSCEAICKNKSASADGGTY